MTQDKKQEQAIASQIKTYIIDHLDELNLKELMVMGEQLAIFQERHVDETTGAR